MGLQAVETWHEAHAHAKPGQQREDFAHHGLRGVGHGQDDFVGLKLVDQTRDVRPAAQHAHALTLVQAATVQALAVQGRFVVDEPERHQAELGRAGDEVEELAAVGPGPVNQDAGAGHAAQETQAVIERQLAVKDQDKRAQRTEPIAAEPGLALQKEHAERAQNQGQEKALDGLFGVLDVQKALFVGVDSAKMQHKDHGAGQEKELRVELVLYEVGKTVSLRLKN